MPTDSDDINHPQEELRVIMMASHHPNNDDTTSIVEHLRENKIRSPVTALVNSTHHSPPAAPPLLDKCDGEETTACLSNLVESSISSLGEDDSVNSSISSMEDEDEEDEPTGGGGGTTHGLPYIAVVEEGDTSRFQNYPRANSSTTLVDDDNTEDTLFFEEEHEVGVGDSRYGCASRFLLARIQADTSLFIAALVLGALAVCCSLWTMTGSGGGGGDEQSWLISSKRTKRRTAHKSTTSSAPNQLRSHPVFPAMELLGISVPDHTSTLFSIIHTLSSSLVEPPYSSTDFQYDTTSGRRSTLPYWDNLQSAIEQTQHIVKEEMGQQLMTNSSSNNDVNGLEELWSGKFSTWGPCYPRSEGVPPQGGSSTDWTQILQTNLDSAANGNRVVYPTYKSPTKIALSSGEESLEGLCRPSFLIIGQGKCGTSSLYHYLTGHPRILPAKEKQIDYFRYHKSIPISWYYSHFPTIETFLGRGALMTGEASPGYMPYPSVVESVVKRLSSNWQPSAGALPDGGSDNGGKDVDVWKANVRSLPKIIAIVRNPIERAKSSYKYNYVEPSIKKLRAGYGVTISGKRIPGKQTDQYYRTNHLFSFEELAFAELDVLTECLKSSGKGESWTFTEFGKGSDTFFYESIQRRNNHTSAAYSSETPPLIHLDEACYAEARSSAQWKQLAVKHPTKFLALPNWPLTQRILGRGVYALPLEWWYEVFTHARAEEIQRIHVVCTEDLSETPDRSMDEVTKFLGLPKFDFANVTNRGRYNVGGHRGYDTITKSNKVDDTGDKLPPVDMFGLPRRPQESSTSSVKKDVDPLLSVSDELMNELVHFYHPYNERLFHLIGKRCPW